MMKLVVIVGLAGIIVPLFGYNSPTSTELSTSEQIELQKRLSSFYTQTPEAMNVQAPKYNVLLESEEEPNGVLRNEMTFVDPLLTNAGKKTLPEFQQARCEHLFKNKFPYLECDKIAEMVSIESNDRMEKLVSTWIKAENIVKNLSNIPVKGEVAQETWSGDYWRMRWGLTSYRYANPVGFATYKSAVESYKQPEEWQKSKGTLSPTYLNATVTRWSPSEKYDLLVGDEKMTLTHQQKQEGSYNVGTDGNVESWFGICHGWAPAAFMVPVPKSSFTAVSAAGTNVTWIPDDVRAMATLAWANGSFPTNFIGGRCNQKDPARYPNGRLSQPECFDNNPATLHLVLGNMIGINKLPLIMDAAFDYQVWNQPLLSYEFQYFNPLNPSDMGTNWNKYAVDYDQKFKNVDRFQKPLTRGQRVGSEHYDDTKVTKVVGVVATVVYLSENRASFSMTSLPNSTIRVSYTYDLEFEKVNGAYVPTGGEWHENTHPDFLWVPQKGSVAYHYSDDNTVSVDLNKLPEAGTTKVAEGSSGRSYPLCKVLEQLVRASSGVNTYHCN